jgi:hypothetical protein
MANVSCEFEMRSGDKELMLCVCDPGPFEAFERATKTSPGRTTTFEHATKLSSNEFDV